MTFDSYYNIKVCLPNIDKQREVGQFLSVVDDKIQLNKRINDNLRASRAQSQAQFELCRGAVVNADVSPNLPWLDRSLREVEVRHVV